MGQERMPHTLWPARTGTSSLLRRTQFPSHPRAGLPEDNVQICSVREATGLFRLLRHSQHPGGALHQHVCTQMSGELNTSGSPPASGSPAAPMFSQTWSPRPESGSAQWDCQGWGRRGAVPCPQGMRTQLQRLFLSAGGSPG